MVFLILPYLNVGFLKGNKFNSMNTSIVFNQSVGTPLIKNKFAISKMGLMFLFVFFLFVNKISFSSGLRFPLYGQLVSAGILAVLVANYWQATRSAILFSVFSFFFVFIFYLFVTPISYLRYAQYWMYLLPLFVFPGLTTSKEFSNLLISVSKFSVFLFIALFFIGVGHSLSYGMPRMEGLMSEPSALALPLSITLVYSMFKRNYMLLVISIIGILLTRSPTVGLVSFSSLLLVFVLMSNRKVKVVAIALSVTIMIAGYYLLVLSPPAVLLEIKFFDRLHVGLLSLITLGEAGYNPRVDLTIGIYDYYKDIWNPVFGLGPNAGDLMLQDGLKSFISLPFDVLLSYGLLGFVLYTISIIVVFFKRNNLEEFICLSVLLVYTTINSAQGIFLQMLFLLLIIMKIFPSRNNKVDLQ